MKAKIFAMALLAGVPVFLIGDYFRRLVEFYLGLANRNAIEMSSLEYMMSAAVFNAVIGAVACAFTAANPRRCACWVGGINALGLCCSLYGFATNPLYGPEFLKNTATSYAITALLVMPAGWAMAKLTQLWLKRQAARPAPTPPQSVARRDEQVFKIDS